MEIGTAPIADDWSKLMFMKEIPISEFRANCLTLLREVHGTREPIRITRLGKPLAEVFPPAPIAVANWMGSMKDSIEILGDIVAPANDKSDWEALRN